VSLREPPRRILEDLLKGALEHTHAGRLMHRQLEHAADRLEIGGEPVPPGARLHVLAAGKAAAAMAAAVEDVAGALLAAGIAVTKDGHGLPLERIALHEAGHPVPDRRSVAAADAALDLAARVPPEDVLLVLLSGGASALLTRPQAGLDLDDLAGTTALLLSAGADIVELNTVRKHLTEISGGRLAARTRARRVDVFAVSDVLGDRLDVIGSGPCVPDPGRFGDALDVLTGRGVLAKVPPRVRAHLEAGVRGEIPESPKPGAPGFERVRTRLLATNRDAREAVRERAIRRGIPTVEVSDRLRGEARVAGRRLAALLGSMRGPAPLCLVAGGETTVTVRGHGRGGRNQELALAAALELAGRPGVALLAAGTDGTDGPTDAAGAFVDGGSTARAADVGLDAAAHLARNDAYSFFAAEGGLVRTGPTHTNVLDLALLLRE
jgi:glycerate-2-kinase